MDEVYLLYYDAWTTNDMYEDAFEGDPILLGVFSNRDSIINSVKIFIKEREYDINPSAISFEDLIQKDIENSDGELISCGLKVYEDDVCTNELYVDIIKLDKLINPFKSF